MTKYSTTKATAQRGLWEKGRRYFAQLDANDGNQYRFLLQDAKTVPEAETARQVLKSFKAGGNFIPQDKSPTQSQM